MDAVISVFGEKFTQQQVRALLHLVYWDTTVAIDSLIDGPTQTALLNLLAATFTGSPLKKVYVDSSDMWLDLVGVYKSGNVDFSRPIRICLDESPALDTGGVRREVFTEVFAVFAENKRLTLFQGPPTYLRPVNSIEALSSGIMKVLGQMIAHSIAMDGNGFPYLSPACFWYLVGGIDKALPFLDKNCISVAVCKVIEEVCVSLFLLLLISFVNTITD